jgi:H+/Cl- antiporter ClcA
MESSNFIKNLKMFISIALIFAGIAMFYVWGMVYGSWNIFAKEYIGVYSIVIVLIISGLVGLLLTVKESAA